MPLVALAGVHASHDQEEPSPQAAEEGGIDRPFRAALLQSEGEDRRASRPGANGRARSSGVGGDGEDHARPGRAPGGGPIRAAARPRSRRAGSGRERAGEPGGSSAPAPAQEVEDVGRPAAPSAGASRRRAPAPAGSPRSRGRRPRRPAARCRRATGAGRRDPAPGRSRRIRPPAGGPPRRARRRPARGRRRRRRVASGLSHPPAGRLPGRTARKANGTEGRNSTSRFGIGTSGLLRLRSQTSSSGRSRIVAEEGVGGKGGRREAVPSKTANRTK